MCIRDSFNPVSRTAQRAHHRRLFEREVSPLGEHRLEAHRVRNPATSPKARTTEGDEATLGVEHLGGRVTGRTRERRDPRGRRAHEADDRMTVTGTVGRERPSCLIRDDEWDHGGIGEGVVGESFELGATSASGASLSPRPVSYTHLDVYKRQPNPRSAGRAHASRRTRSRWSASRTRRATAHFGRRSSRV